MKKNGYASELKIYFLLVIFILILIYLNYHLYIKNFISIEIYSLALSILGGSFLWFLQKMYSYKYENAIIKLSKISEIDNLIKISGEKKQKIKKLEQERKNLEQIIIASATKLYLEKRYVELEKRLKNTYEELISIKEELIDFEINIQDSISKKQIDEIEKLIKHRKRGDIIFHMGKRKIIIPRNLLDMYPFGGISLPFLSLIELIESINKLRKK
jgi:hypothetical protein